MNAISVQNVSKVYKLYDKPTDRLKEALKLTRKPLSKNHYALKDVNFDVGYGETVGIIGTNGAGKSTILKIITGVLNPSEGNVEINGRISALLELGAGFNAEYSGLENVYLNGMMIGFTREEIDAKLQDILDFADIGDFIYQPVKTYSSGMFVRLAFAVAINIDPEILIVDEALSVGDAFFQTKCYHKFEEFKKSGKTILFVSHDLSSINKYCDRVVLLNKGTKLAEGEPKEMIDLYKKLLTGSDEDAKEVEEQYSNGSASEEKPSEKKGYSFLDDAEDKSTWKSHFELNDHILEYGDHKADIIDVCVMDEDGQMTGSIIKGTEFVMKTKVRFNEDVKEPIFTYTFKTVKGVDVTGTNTLYEKLDIPEAKAGDEYVVEYRQKMDLQGGEYMLSMSCTEYVNGELKAHHRCYDLMCVTVISDKNTVGFYDMNSEIKVEKVN